MQPVKGCQPKNERAQIKKWCKMAPGVEAKWHKTNRQKTRVLGIYVQMNNHLLRA